MNGAGGAVGIGFNGTPFSASMERGGVVVAGGKESDASGIAAATTPEPSAGQSDSNDAADPTVYVTATGKKYHRTDTDTSERARYP